MTSALLAAALALPQPWNAWKWSAPIAPSRSPMQSITVPPWLYGGANAGLSDLRIIDSTGKQIPFTIVVRSGSSAVQWQESRLDNFGFIAGRYTQVVASAGVPAQDYTAIEISTPRTNFATTVDVYASDDRRNWRTVRSGAPIFDYDADGLGSNTRIRIPPSHSPYYRLEVRDPDAAFPIDAVSFAQGAVTPPELTRYGSTRATVRERGGDTIVRIDAGNAHLPVSFVRLDTSSRLFSRQATLESSDDGTNWTDVAASILKRTPGREVRSIRFDEVQARYWTLIVANGGDAPLRNINVELWGVPRRIVFAPAGARSYRLLFGNAAAQPPLYDFASVHSVAAIQAAAPASLKAPVYNAAFRKPELPWSERNPWVLWAALTLAMIGVGGLAIRVLLFDKKQCTEPPS